MCYFIRHSEGWGGVAILILSRWLQHACSKHKVRTESATSWLLLYPNRVGIQFQNQHSLMELRITFPTPNPAHKTRISLHINSNNSFTVFVQKIEKTINIVVTECDKKWLMLHFMRRLYFPSAKCEYFVVRLAWQNRVHCQLSRVRH